MARQDQLPGQARVDELNTIRGFFKPIFRHEDPVTGAMHILLHDEDLQAIAQGYGCANGRCLADFGGIVRTVCPVCHEPVEAAYAPARDEWGQHLADRESGYSGPVPDNPFAPATFEEFMRGVEADRDIEHRKL